MKAALGLMLAAMIAMPAYSARDIATLRNIAEAGDVQAQFELAEAYRAGRGVKADPDTAVTWYRRAAAKGHARASDELGFTLFANGDRREAIPYIQKAAARGDARAFYLLGTAHFNGDYVARDWPLAYAQTMRAAEGGIAAARKNLEVMGRYLLAGDRAKADQILETLPPLRTAGAVEPPSRPAAPPPPAPSPPPPPARSGGAWKVQLGAYGSADRAQAGWRLLVARVKRLGSVEQRITRAGGTYRLQAAGLASQAEAQALCRDVKRARGACYVIAP